MAGNSEDILGNPPIESGEDDENTQSYSGTSSGQNINANGIVENPLSSSTTTSSNNPNIDFVTRILHETGNQVYGVEILLYDGSGESPIKQVLITDENEFNAWVGFIENMKDAYVQTTTNDFNNLTQLRVWKQQLDEGLITQTTYDENKASLEWSDFHNNSLETILKNDPIEYTEGGQTLSKYPFNINATTFMGFNSDDFAKFEHNHNYAPIKHTDSNGIYGVGDTDYYGHVKIVNNLDNGLDNIGHALSAYQGYLLNQRVKTLEETDKYAWSDTIPVSTDMATSLSYKYNDGLNLCVLDVLYNNCDKFKTKATTITIGQIPNGYRPTQIATTPTVRGDVVVYVNTSGKIKIRSMSKITSNFNIQTQLLWYYKKNE